MGALTGTLHSSRSARPSTIPTTFLKLPSRFSTGPRSPAAPLRHYGKGAQYGLRKSQRQRRNRLLPELRQGALRQLRAQRGWRADPLRTLLDGMADLPTAFGPTASGRAQPFGSRGAGSDSRRGRHVQRPVLQRFHPRGRLRGAHQHHRPLPDLRPVHCGLDPLPVVRGLPHGQGAARRPAGARSVRIERGGQLAEPGHADAEPGPTRRRTRSSEPRLLHSRPGRAGSGRAGYGRLSASVCGTVPAAPSIAIPGPIHAALSAHSAGSARVLPPLVLGTQGAGRRYRADCPGAVVSAGAAGCLPRPLHGICLAADADCVGRLADRSPSWRFARRIQMSCYILIRRLRVPAFVLLVGVIALLAQAHILGWDKSWPLYLILAGVLLLAERAALAAAGGDVGL